MKEEELGDKKIEKIERKEMKREKDIVTNEMVREKDIERSWKG